MQLFSLDFVDRLLKIQTCLSNLRLWDCRLNGTELPYQCLTGHLINHSTLCRRILVKSLYSVNNGWVKVGHCCCRPKEIRSVSGRHQLTNLALAQA